MVSCYMSLLYYCCNAVEKDYKLFLSLCIKLLKDMFWLNVVSWTEKQANSKF
jgi:hypothetical protein